MSLFNFRTNHMEDIPWQYYKVALAFSSLQYSMIFRKLPIEPLNFLRIHLWNF